MSATQALIGNRVPTPLQAMRAMQLVQDYQRECGKYEAVMPSPDWIIRMDALVQSTLVVAPAGAQVYKGYELSLGECQQLYSASLPCRLNIHHPVQHIFIDTWLEDEALSAAQRWFADAPMRRCPTCGHIVGLDNINLTRWGV